MKAALLLLAGAVLIAAGKAPPNVRIVSADEAKPCQYLSLVVAHAYSPTDSASFALKMALLEVAKQGGDSFYVTGRSHDWLNGANIIGQALRFATKRGD